MFIMLFCRYPWNDEALAKAKTENKLIFLSVGYSTCHWCHVMERESFENESVASIMNEHFVNIKVDREERPDIDRVYMTFVQVLLIHILRDSRSLYDFHQCVQVEGVG